MSLSKSQRYERLSKRAGIAGSTCLIVFLVSLFATATLVSEEHPQNWLGVLCGVSFLATAACCVTCLVAAVLSRFKSKESETERPIDRPYGIEKFIEEAKRLLGEGRQQEIVLRHLRDIGCSKVQSVIILASASNCGMAEAKQVVHFSQAWADTKESDEEFHKRIEQEAKKSKQ